MPWEGLACLTKARVAPSVIVFGCFGVLRYLGWLGVRTGVGVDAGIDVGVDAEAGWVGASTAGFFRSVTVGTGAGVSVVDGPAFPVSLEEPDALLGVDSPFAAPRFPRPLLLGSVVFLCGPDGVAGCCVSLGEDVSPVEVPAAVFASAAAASALAFR